ncbi:MAG TPA: NAD(P)H-hydrate epimerase [Phycisphaerae bacterium]|nr:NAD(P)H-hydrate epimerase [Phycisphaerae bacterium]
MMKSLTREEVRRMDRYAIDRLKVPGVVLMENAGRNVADAIEQFLDGLAGKSVSIVAGAGNNGGDGFVIARHLANRAGRVVSFLVAPEGKTTGDAAVNLTIIRNLGHDIRQVTPENVGKLSDSLRGFDLIVDAVGGTGIAGGLQGIIATAVEQINAAGRPVVAVDIPTGLDCDTGTTAGPAVKADLTVTFLARKKGFDSERAGQYTGKVVVAGIGVSPEEAAGAIEQVNTNT